MARTKLVFTKHCLPFVAYMEMHNDPIQTNDANIAHTQPCICLSPANSCGFQGNYRFLNFKTGWAIERRQFKELLASDAIIHWVKVHAQCDHLAWSTFFTNHHCNPFSDDLHADNATISGPINAFNEWVDSENAGVDDAYIQHNNPNVILQDIYPFEKGMCKTSAAARTTV